MANHSLMYFFNVGRRLFSLGKIDFILAKNCQSLFAIGQNFKGLWAKFCSKRGFGLG